MGATYRKRGKHSFLITVHHNGQKEFKTIRGTEQDARDLVKVIHQQEVLGKNVMEALRTARAVVPPKPEPVTYPRLRDALPAFLDTLVALGDIRASTARAYRVRPARWVFPHVLPDGRKLGDLPVDQVTRAMLGAVLLKTRTAGLSMAVREQIRNPIKKYFADLIERKQFPPNAEAQRPNPAADLKFFMGKLPSKRARKSVDHFTPEEVPQLFATVKAGYPRWFAFIATGVLAALRWGETAALQKSDIDWKKGQLHVQHTVSGNRRRIEACKDGESRWVVLTPALAAILREHVANVSLDGAVNEWTPEQRAWVFPDKRGQTRQHPPFVEVWQSMLRKAGLPHRPYKTTRHTFATGHLEAGADIRWVQEQMGHASIAQTVDTYGHLQPDRHAQSAGRLDQYLGVSAQ